MASRDRALSAKAKEKLGITEAWEVSLAAKQLNGSNEHDGVDTSQAQFEADFQLVDEGVTALAQKTDFLKKARLEHVSDWSSAKAMHLLGLRPSSAKLQAWLGFETEEVLLEEIESEMRRVRDLDPTELEDHAPEKAVSILTDSGRPKRKKSVKESVRREHFASRDPKAIEVMGHDPSETKVMAVLGLDLDGLEAARNEVGETYTLSARTERERRTGINNIRKNKKALAFLGVDPSFRKKMQQLGLNEEELRQEELALQVARLEREYKRRVAQAYARNKRDSSKALATLGYDPSRQKVMYLLGFDPHDEAKLFGDLESATQEPVMSLGWRWMLAFLDTLREDEDEDMHDQAAEGSRADADEKKLRRRSINRTEARKALAVLGVDPSQQKLMDQTTQPPTSTLSLDSTRRNFMRRSARPCSCGRPPSLLRVRGTAVANFGATSARCSRRRRSSDTTSRSRR
eukprot:TRINITY_DN5761_c0_g1_i2.p1 TRINITY_DN5761_c0_g1~~TRINITY_DN5761_c0_g1_i2.p1  ORF type:complete len:460 (+),score=91.23 TRINITY_DN5761_c0_g1_i2:209-1588(+)